MSLKTAIVQPGMFKAPPFSVDAPGIVKGDGETIPRRNPKCANAFISRPEEDINTLFDVLLRAQEKFGDLDAMRTRSLIKIQSEVRKVKRSLKAGRRRLRRNGPFLRWGPSRI
jgi:long-chain acyl-CoA synthetase